MMFFTDEQLKDIREKISCPQFGDKHYGEWGILNFTQRRTILKLLGYIDELKADREWLVDCVESEKVMQALKEQIDLADLDKVAVISEVPLSVLTDAFVLLHKLIADGSRQRAEIEKLKFSKKLHLETDCENCPNKNTCDEIDVIQQTLALINRQRAEIEQYIARVLNDTEYIEKIEVENRKQQAEIERLKHEIAEQEHAKCIPCINETKKQAFKEFAEELMKNYILPTKREIKKLLNKKVGEGNVAKN